MFSNWHRVALQTILTKNRTVQQTCESLSEDMWKNLKSFACHVNLASTTFFDHVCVELLRERASLNERHLQFNNTFYIILKLSIKLLVPYLSTGWLKYSFLKQETAFVKNEFVLNSLLNVIFQFTKIIKKWRNSLG